MKRTFIILLFLIGALGIAGSSQAYSNVSFSFSYHDALGPYGTWVNVSNYGPVFRPAVYAGWRPYTVGHWVYTDYGPMWDTAEPFGWATYHYGYWIFTAAYGWVWVPGYEYYPSRVSWAYGDDYLGWSPIYPNPGYSNVNFWVFIDRDHYGYNNYSPYYLGGDRIRPLFDQRVVQVRDGYRWDRGDFERVVSRPVQVVRVRENTFEANGRRVRMVVPENRESQVIREVSRAAKVKRGDRIDNSKDKVVTANRPAEKSKSSSAKKADVQQSSRSKAVTKSEPKKFVPKKTESSKHSSKPSSKHSSKPSSFSSNKKHTVEPASSSKSKALVRSTAPKKSSSSSAKFSSSKKSSSSHAKFTAPKKSSSSSAKFTSSKKSSSSHAKYSAPKKSSTSEAKFSAKRADVKPKTSYTSNKKMESKQSQSKKKAVKKPSHKQHKKF